MIKPSKIPELNRVRGLVEALQHGLNNESITMNQALDLIDEIAELLECQ